MRAVTLTLTFALCASSLAGEPTPEERKAVLDVLRSEAARLPALRAQERELSAKKDASSKKRAKELRDEIAAIKADKPEDFAPKLELSKAGEFGALPHPKVIVRNVIDAQTVLIETRTNRPAGQRDQSILIVVHGVDTSKWADDLDIDAPPGAWLVTQEKRGGRTVLAIQPFKLTKDEAESVMKLAKP